MTTTVVGSYPVPEWLKQCSDEEALGDALTVVMDAQRRAGVELICDGELGRWDLSGARRAGWWNGSCGRWRESARS